MSETSRASVSEAAARARILIDRAVGNADGSNWLDQMEAGQLPGDWPEGHADAVAEMLGALGERARHTRAVAGTVAGHAPQPASGSGFIPATQARLPMNRKERFFTGAVLPMLIADNGFVHLHRFLALCGLDVDAQDPSTNSLNGDQDLQLFSEYGFAESVFTHADRQRLSDRPIERDTPDVVLMAPDWLVAVEAKMYHRPSRTAINLQLSKQRVLVDYWVSKFDLDPRRVAHVLLLPEGLARDRQPLDAPVVTWEEVHHEYSAVGPAYWLGVLGTALDRYGELHSPEPTFRTNPDEMLTGEEIVEAHAQGTLVYHSMGRNGGKGGDLLSDDIVGGGWREQSYEVRRDPDPINHNWFLISEFIAKISKN